MYAVYSKIYSSNLIVGAVVAREYGLPCLIGVTDVCNYFKTGDKVLLAADVGKIELISRKWNTNF